MTRGVGAVTDIPCLPDGAREWFGGCGADVRSVPAAPSPGRFHALEKGTGCASAVVQLQYERPSVAAPRGRTGPRIPAAGSFGGHDRPQVRYRARVAAGETRAKRVPIGARLTDRRLVAACVLAAIALRLPFLHAPLGIDEGGYAYVAAHWNVGDGGIYGDQWVDRPPLLIALYAVAIAVAGDVGVRLLGCVAAAVLVVSSAGVAHRVAGRTAMTWSAVAAVVLSSSTLWQAHTVNAELPAAAFVAASVWMTVLALGATTSPRAFGAAIGAGVLAGCAMLVKQSFLDGFVFAGAALVGGAVLARGAARRRLAAALWGGIVGTAIVAAMLVAWAELSGPGLGALVDALYGFRLDARSAIDRAEAPKARAMLLLVLVTGSGLLALLAYTWIGLVRIARGRQSVQVGADSRLLRATAVGLGVLTVWGVFAVTQGGNWWRHYLVQLIPVLAMGLGIVAGAIADHERSRIARGSTRAGIAVSIAVGVTWAIGAAWAATGNVQRESAVAGDWLRAASQPGDTIVVTWGHPNVLRRSGMRSPYGMSWSLPIRVRDPRLEELREVIAGATPPTWIMEWTSLDLWGMDRDGDVRRLVAERYERVADVCGRDVYRLRTGTSSAASALPPAPSSDACDPGAFTDVLGGLRW